MRNLYTYNACIYIHSFDFITYADDTTFTNILSAFENTRAIDNCININTEILKISDWLKINIRKPMILTHVL